ncbi:lysylphosphatidylglycerol synthase transmembrane domain-containing protein [Streptomyces sp. NPDC052036]|uniref:lysylphosphatidylglycerol synthase transmembrane domain-containing protein n=1 Tax=Streptomyces sp. NPDC052036 TaxID=3155171 RepID=UPI003443BCDF
MSLFPLDDLPRAPAALVRSPVTARLARRALTLFPLVLLAGWAVVDWHAVRDGTARLASADPRWLPALVLLTCLGWVNAAWVRQGAVPERLPAGPLLASQFAAGAANHVLPASIGAHAVTLRFLQTHGIPLARATASLALYSLVKPIAKTLVLLVFPVFFPGVLMLSQLVPGHRTLILITAVAATGASTVCVLVTVVRPLQRPVFGFVRTALTDARILHTRPSRVLALWGGAAVSPVLQATTIAAVGGSLGLQLSWAQVVFAFLAASTAAGAVPAPGGIGPVDAALVFALVGYGTPLDLATATVIGYRVLTVWLPLLPGMLVLTALVHRKVL